MVAIAVLLTLEKTPLALRAPAPLSVAAAPLAVTVSEAPLAVAGATAIAGTAELTGSTEAGRGGACCRAGFSGDG